MTINEVFWFGAGSLWFVLACYFAALFLFARPRMLLNVVWVLACLNGVALALRELHAMGALGAAVFGMGGLWAALLAAVLVVTYETQVRR